MRNWMNNLDRLFLITGEDRSKVVKMNILLSFLNRGVAILISLLLIPLTINYVDSQQYGIWLTLSSIVNWVSYFDLGFGHGFRNRFAEAIANNDIVLAKKYVSTTYATLTFIFVIIFLIFAVMNSFLDWNIILNIKNVVDLDLSKVFLLSAGMFCLQLILNTFTILLLALQKAALSSMINTISQLLILIIIYILKLLSEGNLIVLSFVMSGVPCLLLFLISLIAYKMKYKSYMPSISNIDLSLVRKIIDLGGKFFIIQICILVIFQCTNIILSRVKGVEAVTEYNIAYKYFSVLYMVFIIFLTPCWSAFTDAYIKRDYKWMKNVYKKLSYIWFVLVLGYIFLLVFSPFIYSFWLGSTINISFSLSMIMGLYILVLSRAGLYMQLINGTGKIQVQMIVYLFFAIVAIPLMILGCQYWGMTGLILVLMTVYLFQCLLGHYQLKKILNGNVKGIWDK